MSLIIEKPLEVDLHVHTVSSGHAFSTLWELRKQAINIGVKIVGISDHGPAMAGAAHDGFFTMRRDVHRASQNCHLLFGCEANILSERGNIDISPSVMEHLDFVLAGLHAYTPYTEGDSSKLRNTKAIIECIEILSPTAISHPIYPAFPIEIIPVVCAAASKGVALEVNARVLNRVSDQLVNSYCELIQASSKHETFMLLSSDSHFVDDLGDIRPLDPLKDILTESENLIINRDIEAFREWWHSNGKQELSI